MFPLLKVNKTNIFWKLMKNQIEWHHYRCHEDSIARFKVVEARKRVRNENCHQDAILRNIQPKFSQQTTVRPFFMGVAKDIEFW